MELLTIPMRHKLYNRCMSTDLMLFLFIPMLRHYIGLKALTSLLFVSTDRISMDNTFSGYSNTFDIGRMLLSIDHL